MEKYLDPQTLARAEALGIKARMIVEGIRVGDHKSPFRGFSVEFVQHREYVPGDDIRHIDWKSYGRSERYTIKQYEQETNFIAHLVLDASRSMNYGRGDQNKLEYAKQLTASLAYLIINQRDGLSLNIFDNRWRTQLPVSSQLNHIRTILYSLEELVPENKTSIGPLLEDLAERVHRRGLVFIISDLFDDPESLIKGLQHLRFQGHDVILFHIMHRDEIDFSFTGNVRFEGLEVPEELKTRPHLIRPNYLKNLQIFLDRVQQACEANQCDYFRMPTDRSLREALPEYLIFRDRSRRRR